ncbi:hypothetical protein N7492_001904 [Penicillium capsulatum]|uniref:Phosphoenolpyruvate phosphomutase n=1 Tax=Penicillium capsulatum TaxID=69766 RepID=A0A9W9IGV8_9EURO|nr:hypothetical protein N7492_001904 [Penicillium capsulatum]
MYTPIAPLLGQHGDGLRLLEAHDQPSTKLIQQITGEGGECFQGVWISGLTQTTHLGIPDTEIISPLQRAKIWQASSRNVDGIDGRPFCAAFDADSGGDVAEIPALVSVLATIGVSMVIIEDKILEEPGKKVNSLLKSSGSQKQADPREFAKVIARFKSAAVGLNLLVTARIESLNVRVPRANPTEEKASLQASLRDALFRAGTYTRVGADAIMIHSKSPSPAEVLDFLRRFRATDPLTPLVVVPTTYSTTLRATLVASGADLIIYANHLMRAKIKAVASVSDQMMAQTPDLFSSDKPARDCLRAHNYGCLLRLLIERDSGHDQIDKEARKYLVVAQKLALANMAAAVKELASGDQSGCEADGRIISVQDLLKINALQVMAV